ncbi:MAG: FAD-binding oxidoreductase [Chloroflexota bacterium]
MSELKYAVGTKNTAGDSPRANELSSEHLEWVPAWGNATGSVAYVYRPTTLEGIQDVLTLARENGRSIGLRGGGNSYGDAATNAENIVLDLRRMNRILDWQPETGRIQVEPGVTLAELWQYILEDGWWPPVATGTSMTTMGGCAAMNVHGKNAAQVGPIGEHIIEFDLLLASGEIITCSREENSDIFHAAIGGFGMLGIFTSLTMQMKRVYSGLLNVETETRRNLADMFSYFYENVAQSNYIVGWIDSLSAGSSLGRGDVHKANYLAPGEDPNPTQTLRLDNQHLGPNLFGVMPRSIMWMFMRPMNTNPGMKLINQGKYIAGRFSGAKRYQQPHVQFHFLLDYIPDFKRAYGPGGLIQYQPFIPKETAQDAFSEILALCQKRGLPNYLTVLKRHRPDDFLMSYAVDGFSMAMDFRVSDSNRHRIAWLMKELDEIVLEAGGRFYFAKDSTLRPEVANAYLGEDRINRFKALKQRCDPEELFQTDLWRRVFA